MDLDGKVVHVVKQVVQNGWEIEEAEPKSQSSSRPVMLSDGLAIELARHRQRRDAAREAAGAASLTLAANLDIKVVSELFGHSGTTITRDISTSVFDPLKRQAVLTENSRWKVVFRVVPGTILDRRFQDPWTIPGLQNNSDT